MSKELTEEVTCAFLNQVFGKGPDTNWFWQTLLKNQVLYDFKYELNPDVQRDIPLGGLLYELSRHCKIYLDLKEDISDKLRNVESPFQVSNILPFQHHSYAYDFKNVEIKKLVNQANIYCKKDHPDRCSEAHFKSLQVKLSLLKASISKEEYEQPHYKSKISKIKAQMAEIWFH